MDKREGEVTRTLKRVAQTMGHGKFDEALRVLLHLSEKYPEAGDIRPQIAEALLRRGESHARHGKAREARADFERSLGWTQKPGALVALARGLMAEGKIEEADKLLNEALELDGGYGPTHETLGMLMLHWNDYAQAARAFEQALECGGSSPDLYLAAWEAYRRLERFDRARELILEGAQRFPQSDALQAAAGDSSGESAEARIFWEKAVALNPKNLGALFRLAAEDASCGDRQASLDFLRRCAKIDLDQTRGLWKEEVASPMGKFGPFVRDADFRRALGWEKD
jgi:tetratricopeptide (TPR) repeat protein